MKTAKRVIFCAAALIALSGLAFSASSAEDIKRGSMGSGSESSPGIDSGSNPGDSTGTDSSPGGATGTDSGDKTYDREDSMQSSPGGPMGSYSSGRTKDTKGTGSHPKKK